MSKEKISRKAASQKAATQPEASPKDETAEPGPAEAPRYPGPDRFGAVRLVPVEQISADPDQPRKSVSQKRLQELASSIRSHGLLQPITVEQRAPDRYQIVTGHRRYQAAQLAGQAHIHCLIQDTDQPLDQQERLARQLVENLQREDLSPVDKARALVAFKNELGKDAPWSEVEGQIGISETTRKQYTRLLKLPEDIQREIVSVGRGKKADQITEKHARALLMLRKHPSRQRSLFKQIQETSISGDDAIQKARTLLGKDHRRFIRLSYSTRDELIDILEKKLEELRAGS